MSMVQEVLVLPISEDERKDTLATVGGVGRRAGGRGGGGAHRRFVPQRGEGESVLCDNPGVVGQIRHSCWCLGHGVVHGGVGVVVDPGGVTTGVVGQDGSVAREG